MDYSEERQEFLVEELERPKKFNLANIYKTFRRRKLMMGCVCIMFTSALLVGIIGTVTFLKGNSTTPGDIDLDPFGNYFRKLENHFMTNISHDSIGKFMKEYSNSSHLAGSDEDKAQAESLSQKLKEWGFNTKIETFHILLNYPITRVVEAFDANNVLIHNCSLDEEAPIIDGKPSSSKVPPFHGFAASGNVTGELIYANFGTEEDYKQLDQAGVNFTGKIVIVRYGLIFRGNKVYSAEKRGAAGVLIFTDPNANGPHDGKAFPLGPWAGNGTVQRGAVWSSNGDPTTPGWPSTEDAPHLSYEDAQDPTKTPRNPLPKIPSQPISFKEAYPLLAALGNGKVADLSGNATYWNGLFTPTYYGPGPVKVHINLLFDYQRKPIWNVIGTIQGDIEPEKVVIVGAHRDAWDFGAGDPITGTSTLLEIARTFGELHKNGIENGETWTPRRTLMICSWDAEEFGLIGSVEFTELHDKMLAQEAVVYLNLDIAVEGRDTFFAAGSPSLFQAVKNVTSRVHMPFLKDTQNKSVYDAWPSEGTGGPKLANLGSGSDYTAFLQHCGVASLDARLKSNNSMYSLGAYHSDNDQIYWYTEFGDPSFLGHEAVAKVYALLALRFVDFTILPFNLTDYADALNDYIFTLEKMANSDNLAVKFNSMKHAVEKFGLAVDSLEAEIVEENSYWDHNNDNEVLSWINDRLMYAERTFLSDDPLLSGDKYYKHVVYAPSKNNYYGSTAFPALYEMISNKDAQTQFLIDRLAIHIDAAADYVSGLQHSTNTTAN
eukprot:TRINITY_DN2647_c0_g1_i1.p1 TRINITY_DN2647_c0_g1~~TRINITY_DN2647_c0_g1_i1.p1  ORF type:complete len:819 (-),score=164.85 TRINITY_DN2647_c0_g1_i1:36-2357(-)